MKIIGKDLGRDLIYILNEKVLLDLDPTFKKTIEEKDILFKEQFLNTEKDIKEYIAYKTLYFSLFALYNNKSTQIKLINVLYDYFDICIFSNEYRDTIKRNLDKLINAFSYLENYNLLLDSIAQIYNLKDIDLLQVKNIADVKHSFIKVLKEKTKDISFKCDIDDALNVLNHKLYDFNKVNNLKEILNKDPFGQSSLSILSTLSIELDKL